MGTSQPQTTSLRLDSWKEIAAFFDRDERTVKRWEKDRALPVHRYPGSARGRVFAYADELSRWLGTPVLVLDAPVAASPSGDSEVQTPAVQAPHASHLLSRKLAAWTAGVLIVCGLVAAAAVRREHSASVLASSTPPAAPKPATETFAYRPVPEAEELYLQGRYYWNRRTPDGLNTAVDYFTQAIVKDPNYADAYVGLADCYNLLREYTIMPAREAFPRAIAAAKRAVELDDNSANAHASLAFVIFYGDWDAAEAERHFQRALALNPNYANAHHWHATFQMTMGHFPEALGEIERAQELDPASAAILADKGLILFLAGQQQPAIELLKGLENSDPTFLSPHRYLADAYLATRRYEEYLTEAELTASASHDDAALTVAKAGEKGFARGGEQGMLRSMLQAQKKLLAEQRVSAFQLARTSALLGERAAALAYLQTAFQAHDSDMVSLRNDVTLRSLHNDRSFRDLVARVGLPPLN